MSTTENTPDPVPPVAIPVPDWGRVMEAAALEVLGEPPLRYADEWRYGTHGSLVVNVSGPRAGQWRSWETDSGAASSPSSSITSAWTVSKHGSGCRTGPWSTADLQSEGPLLLLDRRAGHPHQNGRRLRSNRRRQDSATSPSACGQHQSRYPPSRSTPRAGGWPRGTCGDQRFLFRVPSVGYRQQPLSSEGYIREQGASPSSWRLHLRGRRHGQSFPSLLPFT